MRTNSMAAMIAEQGSGHAQVQGAGGEAETVAVPASALRLFLNLLTEMSQGNAVTLIRTHRGDVAVGIWRRSPDARLKWGQAVSDASRMPRRSVAGLLGASAGASYLRD